MTVGERGYFYGDSKESNRLIERVLAGNKRKEIKAIFLI